MASTSSSGTSSSSKASSGATRSSTVPEASLCCEDVVVEVPSEVRTMATGADEDVEVVVIDEEPGDFSESGSARLPSNYQLSRSQVTEEILDEYVKDGLMSPAVRLACRAPRREEVSAPKAYEAVIFYDFLTAGLRFPCEHFVCEVLEGFNLQIHHLTPNVFLWMGVFAMALKMMGSEVEINTFTKYYESQFHEKIVVERSGQGEKRAKYGSYNFVP